MTPELTCGLCRGRLVLVPLSFPTCIDQTTRWRVAEYDIPSILSKPHRSNLTRHRYSLWNGRFSQMSRTHWPFCQGELLVVLPFYTIQSPASLSYGTFLPGCYWQRSSSPNQYLAGLGEFRKVVLRSFVVWRRFRISMAWIFFDNRRINQMDSV